MTHFVYILASHPKGTVHVGRTWNLRQRVDAHRMGLPVHRAKGRVRDLVWFEAHEDYETSEQRERSLKRWRRARKDALIAKANPEWRDLTGEIPVEG
jgi:putative endonuclease